MEDIIAPSEAWCILQGERPCRVRPSQPPVSSLAPGAELGDPRRTIQVKRRQRTL
jgi:hypothetical protein